MTDDQAPANSSLVHSEIQHPPADPLSSAQRPARRPVNLRSILLGLLGVVLICTLAPYNDLAVNNTQLIGDYLPLGLLLFFVTFILLINGPLHRLAPRAAFSSGELAVSLGMVLVGCAVPAAGLMRYLPAALVGVTHSAAVSGDYAYVLRELHLPQWIFPTIHQTDPLQRASSPIIQEYWYRAQAKSDTFLDHFQAVPWHGWITPALVWGLFIAAFFGAILCTAVIVRRQWIENERLPFPIAEVYLSLVEPPRRGNMFNSLFHSRSFWLAAGIVFVIHFFNGMATYDKRWPTIPLEYDLTSLLNKPPWAYMEPESARGAMMGFKHNAVVFAVVGITFFLQTKIAFSLWFFYVFFQAERVLWGSWQSTFSYPQQQDQQIGAILPFALAFLWVGREHWMIIIRQMFGRGRAGDPRGRYLPYSVAGWGLVISLAVMIGWLVVAGCSVIGGIVLVGLIMLIMTVTARVVAETGMLFVQLGFPYWRPWLLALRPPLNIRTTGRSFFYDGLFSMIIGHDVRETLSVFSTHALKVADETIGRDEWDNELATIEKPATEITEVPEKKSESSVFSVNSVASRSSGPAFFATLVLSLVVAFVVSGMSMLYVEYNHGVTLDATQQMPINSWATEEGVKSYIMDPTYSYLPPRNGPSEQHNAWGQFTFGFGLVTALSVLRLRFAWWPLHPVGFLLAYGWPMKQIWFSIFLGWLAKVLVVKFGGIRLFRTARNAFIGLIIGDAMAAGFWMIVCLVLASRGMEYHLIRLFPM